MKLSTRSTYGMRALMELALAFGQGPLSATLIASRQNLSVAYLEQLLHRLKKRGLVTSVRGPKGGYVLAKDPNRVTVADVVRILDGGTNGMTNGKNASARHAGGRANAQTRQAERIADAVWRCVHERLAQSLDAVTLHDLCEEVRSENGDPLEHRYVFHI
jgi:Rrf2 family protein